MLKEGGVILSCFWDEWEDESSRDAGSGVGLAGLNRVQGGGAKTGKTVASLDFLENKFQVNTPRFSSACVHGEGRCCPS